MARRVLATLGLVFTLAACGTAHSSQPLSGRDQQAARTDMAARLTPADGFAKGGQQCPAQYVCYTAHEAQPASASDLTNMAGGFGVRLSKSQCDAPLRTQNGRFFQHCMGYGRYADWEVAVLLTVARNGPQGTQTQLAFAPVRGAQ